VQPINSPSTVRVRWWLQIWLAAHQAASMNTTVEERVFEIESNDYGHSRIAVSQKDLDKAPESLLSIAAEQTPTGEIVKLTSWSEADIQVLKVMRGESVSCT